MNAKLTYSMTHRPTGQEAPTAPELPDQLAQAAEVAADLLTLANIPHRFEHRDQRHDTSQAATPLYGFYAQLSGPANKAQPLYFGWTYQPPNPWTLAQDEPPPETLWSPAHACNTTQARDFPLTHITVSEILRQWHQAGLITDPQDSTGWLETQNPRRLAAVHRQTIASLRNTIDWYEAQIRQL